MASTELSKNSLNRLTLYIGLCSFYYCDRAMVASIVGNLGKHKGLFSVRNWTKVEHHGYLKNCLVPDAIWLSIRSVYCWSF